MYAGDNKGQLLEPSPSSAGAPVHEAIPESGPALEVIEMANGETIWCALGSFFSRGQSFANTCSQVDRQRAA